FPEQCPDGQGPIGTDKEALSPAVQAEMPGLSWPLVTSDTVDDIFFSKKEPFAPDTVLILDFIEFCHRIVAKPIEGSYHSFFSHHHLSFDKDEGENIYRGDINRLFLRNGLAYVLNENGQIERLAPAVLRESLGRSIFKTGDQKLDAMLEDSSKKFLNPSISTRREAVEGLWHCWERLKSIEDPKNKKKSINALLDKVISGSEFRCLINEEALKLTEIGNSFHIRHSEVGKPEIEDSEHVDYLFHRLFSLISLLL